MKNGIPETSPLEMEVGDLGRIVQQRIPYRLLLRLEQIENKEKFSNRTDTINAVLEIGLFAYEHKEVLEDPHMKEEIMNQLKEGGLVDFFRTLSPTDFNVIWQLARTEARSRGVKK